MPTEISRRSFVSGGALFLCSAGMQSAVPAQEGKGTYRIGLVTDLHYADKAAAGSRHYRESRDKLSVAKKQFQTKPLDMLVELGDLVDAAKTADVELGYLKTINRDLSAICQKRHYVLGNHCVQTLNKTEFLGAVEQKQSYYSFDAAGYHFVVLDSCFRSDGETYACGNFKWTDANIPEKELAWLQTDLKNSKKPTIVFAHQRLDVKNNHGVKNAAEVRKLLESSGRVRAVFQGHSHKNDHKLIGGIHYCTLVAMVEGSGPKNNGFSVMHLHDDGLIQIEGFIKQAKYDWKA